MKHSSKKWSIACLILTGLLLAVIGAVTVVIDPFFHFHAPLPFLRYSLDDERYQNDGIVRHFDYNAILTGTSLSENFKTSELDALFGLKSVKVCFAGGSYKEISNNLFRAAKASDDLRAVFWGLDAVNLLDDKDYMGYASYPSYLYDNNPLNDVEYVFNKSILIRHIGRSIAFTATGRTSTSFDTYSSWMHDASFGKEVLDSSYARGTMSDTVYSMTEADYQRLTDNLTQNVLRFAEANPDTELYLFFSPYSIYYWDSLRQAGVLQKHLDAQKRAIELLLSCDNIRLYSFLDAFEIVCNLGNYMDVQHYHEGINAQLLVWMQEGAHRLTDENYLAYCDTVQAFYTNYDYDALFADRVK